MAFNFTALASNAAQATKKPSMWRRVGRAAATGAIAYNDPVAGASAAASSRNRNMGFGKRKSYKRTFDFGSQKGEE